MMIVCVGALLLFHAANGPYSAVHGPTTALRARRGAWLLLAGIALAALAWTGLVAAPGIIAGAVLIPSPLCIDARDAGSPAPPLRC